MDIEIPLQTMAGSVVTRKRKIKRGAKVKTGCATCRIRKVKCDESKPFCQKCVDTGRVCDGYESRFRSFTNHPTLHANAGFKKSYIGASFVPPAVINISTEDIELLNRYFSTKTIFDVDLGCDEEARQVLQASLTNPPIRHAVLSLKALREDLEVSGYNTASIAQQTPSYYYGLQQYSLALRGLASNLSSPGSGVLKPALLCCQILSSIEQVRKNYAAMAQHIVRGLKIMREYRARPGFVAADKLIPANHEQLPMLDVFIIKLFAAPCKFKLADPPTMIDVCGTNVHTCPILPHQQPHGSRDLRTIAPDMRPELTRIAGATLEFLGKVSRVKSVEVALLLLSEKSALLDSLESWLAELELSQVDTNCVSSEPVSISFMRLFYSILRTVLLGALDSSPHLHTELRAENNRLQASADIVAEKLRDYSMFSGTSNIRGHRGTAR